MKQTLFYQHVTVLDYAYTDDHLGVVGDSAIVDVELIGEQNSEFMLLDFGKVKSQIKGEIDFLCDHRLVVPSSCVEQLSDQQVRLVYSFGPKESQLEYLAPKQAYFLLDSHRVSDESLTTELEKLILKKLPTNITGLKISLRREQKLEEVYFQYTHGLKLHGGNCQRLLHGHRNTLRVFINQKRSRELEDFLAVNEFASSTHFCYWENVANKEEIQALLNSEVPRGRLHSNKLVEINYVSAQGEFKAKLPAYQVYLLPVETTVENLSYQFSQILKDKLDPGSQITVWAFEGIGKGAKSTLY